MPEEAEISDFLPDLPNLPDSFLQILRQQEVPENVENLKYVTFMANKDIVPTAFRPVLAGIHQTEQKSIGITARYPDDATC